MKIKLDSKKKYGTGTIILAFLIANSLAGSAAYMLAKKKAPAPKGTADLLSEAFI